MKILRFGPTISPRQGSGPRVICFTATPSQVDTIARIDRISRDLEGKLKGFQRQQISSHVSEIEAYLRRPDAMLPNAIVLAFSDKAYVDDQGYLCIDVTEGPPGWVVDGQQRFSASKRLGDDNPFEFVVSAFLCEDRTELNRQFILINNTKPLAKPLIYELLPGVADLPFRLSSRSEAAWIIEALNYRQVSSLFRQIHQQTNPDGILKDTLIQKMLINSLQNGALRHAARNDRLMTDGFELVSNFFAAVQQVFARDWVDHKPKSSRLLHGVGLIAMGYVLDQLEHKGCRTVEDFVLGLQPLLGRTHWSSGEWVFPDQRRRWDTLQNTSADYRLVSDYFMRLLRHAPPIRAVAVA